jgi:colicin import membrane protein
MAKKLKVYQTSIGFFDLAVAAPSMKAAAEAWGADPDIFKRGFAKQTEDPKVVEATIATPGVVLRRPVGSHGEFTEKAVLPKAPEGRRPAPQDRAKRADTAQKRDTKSDEKARRNAAAALEKEKRNAAAALEEEKKRQVLDRAKAEAERERAKKQREQMIAKADAAFERARSRHDDAVDAIRQRREELDKDEAREDQRWKREQQAHDDALKEAKA